MARRRFTWILLLVTGLWARSPLVTLAAEAAPPTPATTPPSAPPAPAAPEIQWRHDYAAALKEAQDKNLPLVIDFGTVNCYWCKKLDESTFRDARIVRALNDRFVPLKVDGEK